MAGAAGRRAAARVALFPLPFQGHVSPMLQLAGAFHARGLAVTVLHTAFNAPDPACHPDFSFVAVPDAISDAVAATEDGGADRVLAMNAAVEAPALAEGVRDALASLLGEAEEGEPRLACLIVDATLTVVQKAAAGLGLPTLVLHTCSAACFRLFRSYDMLYDKGYLPAQESNLHLPVKELPPLQVCDLFDPSKLFPNKQLGLKLLNLANETTTRSSGAIINTFEALEAHELEVIRGELADKGIPIFAIGPLHKLTSIDGVATSLLNQDHSCIQWLDTQDSGTVLYVSFGSVVHVTRDEFADIAWGLANSGKPFLWVVRRGLVLGVEEPPELPEGFESAVMGRGKVIEWAPQQKVLAHPAVGGFWTHNGWNSTLESVYQGVPMLSRPLFGDQLATGRYVADAWKIGVLLEGVLERGGIEKAVRKLMGEKEGMGMRERAKDLKEEARVCLESSGSSQQAVDKLVDHILSLGVVADFL